MLEGLVEHVMVGLGVAAIVFWLKRMGAEEEEEEGMGFKSSAFFFSELINNAFFNPQCFKRHYPIH